MSATEPDIYDHLRSTDPDDDDTIYRVVGTATGSVTLLRVADGDGRRANTGKVRTVSREALSAFEPAENPDGNRGLGTRLASVFKMVYWSLRTFVGSLAANPVPAVVALALVAAGSLTGTPLPDAVSTALVFVGIFALSYIGSGRL